jgi:hypothetical protein
MGAGILQCNARKLSCSRCYSEERCRWISTHFAVCVGKFASEVTVVTVRDAHGGIHVA